MHARYDKDEEEEKMARLSVREKNLVILSPLQTLRVNSSDEGGETEARLYINDAKDGFPD